MVTLCMWRKTRCFKVTRFLWWVVSPASLLYFSASTNKKYYNYLFQHIHIKRMSIAIQVMQYAWPQVSRKRSKEFIIKISCISILQVLCCFSKEMWQASGLCLICLCMFTVTAVWQYRTGLLARLASKLAVLQGSSANIWPQ